MWTTGYPLRHVSGASASSDVSRVPNGTDERPAQQLISSYADSATHGEASAPSEERTVADVLALRARDDQMLAIIAVVLIALWLFGFLAFHITAGVIHIALVVGVILLVLHFVRR